MSERQLIKQMAEAVVDAVEPLGKQVVAVANREAAARGLDGRYVQFVLNRDLSSWPNMPGRQEEALGVMVAIARAAFVFNSSNFSMPPVEQEEDVNDAVKAVASWAWDSRRTLLQKTYMTALRPYLRQAQAHLHATTGRTWTDREAFFWQHAALKEAVEHEPLGIDRALLIYQIADLIG
jgi:hypothetical protein